MSYYNVCKENTFTRNKTKNNNIRAETSGNLRTCAPSEDSDQTAHPRSLIWIFTGLILDRQVPKFLHADNGNEDWLYCTDAQADLSLRWTHTHVEVHVPVINNVLDLFLTTYRVEYTLL